MPTGFYKRIKPVSLETRNKIRIAHMGKKLTEDHKSKLRGKRKPLSLEHKKKLGIASSIRGQTQKTRDKLSKIFSGANSHFWKGGITPLVRLLRKLARYRQWRCDVFERDEFICQLCFQKGGELNADHYPKTFSNIIHEYNMKTLEEAIKCEELWNINNGRTLCVTCHRKTETYGRPK
jgi:hypothetical protein